MRPKQRSNNISTATVEQARAADLRPLLGAHASKLKKQGAELVGPCPRCGGRDRFNVNVRKRLWRCRVCGQGGDAIDLVTFLDGCGFREAFESIRGSRAVRAATGTRAENSAPSKRDDDAHTARQAHKAAWMWSLRKPIAGTPAERYLRDVRGITGALPLTVAYLPPRHSKQHPAMIAPFCIPEEPEPGVLKLPPTVTAVHLTLLDGDSGGKAKVENPKRFVGRPLGRPIVLAPPNDLLGLVITEGIEEALSAHEVTGLGAWAAGSAGMLPSLADRVPDYIETVTIIADDDASGAGRRGAYDLADRLKRRGIEVTVEESVR